MTSLRNSNTESETARADQEEHKVAARHREHAPKRPGGPGLSWAELTIAADNDLPGGSTTDPHARLMLLLPAFGDDAIPDEAIERLTAALRARTRVEVAERLAAARLAYQGEWGPTHWTTGARGYLINEGDYSFRNPANRFAWPTASPRPDRQRNAPLAARPAPSNFRSREMTCSWLNGQTTWESGRGPCADRMWRGNPPAPASDAVEQSTLIQRQDQVPVCGWHGVEFALAFLQCALQSGVGLIQPGDRGLGIGIVCRRAEPRSVPRLFSRMLGEAALQLPEIGRQA